MRILSKLLVGVTATATVGVLGLAGTAAAQSTGSHIQAAAVLAAPEGVVTAVTLKCPSNGTPTKLTSTPVQPTTVNTTAEAHGFTLSGVWGASGNPPPAPPGPFALKATCSTGTATGNLTISIAPGIEDITGVGSDTIQNIMDQFSGDYNATSGPKTNGGSLYSWDATNPVSGAIGDTIDIKDSSPATDTCAQARPDGSSAGITALETTNPVIGGDDNCISFARSSRARGTDPDTVSFIDLAGDAVTYATEKSSTGAASNVPSNLTTAELASIYECKVTNWNQLPGGKSGTPEIFIPQTSSGTRSFFLTAIGVATPGPCANDLPTTQFPGGTLEENEGVNPAFAKNPQDVIFPFSVGKWLAEAEHSATCLVQKAGSVCTAQTSGPNKGRVCVPAKGQNLFGCNTHGQMNLQMVNSTNPTTPYPPTKASVINSGFSATFQRILFEVSHNPCSGTNPVTFCIPGPGNPDPTDSTLNLQALFGPTGFTCTNKTAQTDLKNYGFLPLPAGTSPGDCGFAS